MLFLVSDALCRPLAAAPACLSLDPKLVLVLGWCSLHTAAAIGGVAVVGFAVVIGMLPGVGCTAVALIETSLALLNLKEKITHPGGKCHPPAPPLVFFFDLPLPPLQQRLTAVAALVQSWWWRLYLSLLHLAIPSRCCSSHSRFARVVYSLVRKKQTYLRSSPPEPPHVGFSVLCFWPPVRRLVQ